MSNIISEYNNNLNKVSKQETVLEKDKYSLQKIQQQIQPLLPIFNDFMDRTPWVKYGENNLLPNYLISRFDNCAIHKSIIISKLKQTMGEKFYCDTYPMAPIMLVNGKENIVEVAVKCTLDYLLFNGFALNVIWSKDRTSIAEIHHVDFSRLRLGKIKQDEEEITKIFYSSDWTNIKKYKPEELPIFNQNTKEPSQILYYKEYSPNNSYYPIPDYSGGLASIELDISIKDFHANNIKNSMTPSLWIDMNNGIPTPEQQELVVRSLKNQYGGTLNAGQPIISFNENPETAPKITPISQNGSDNYYTSVYDDIIRSILSAHRVSSGELFGISTAGKLGSQNEIQEHSEFFYKTVIIPYQINLLFILNKVMTIKVGEPIIMKVKPIELFKNKPVENKPTDSNINPQVL
jgi:hypothetical protein